MMGMGFQRKLSQVYSPGTAPTPAEMYFLSVRSRSPTQLQQLANKLSTYEFVEIGTIRGESRAGEKFMEFYADADHVKEFVVQSFYELKR